MSKRSYIFLIKHGVRFASQEYHSLAACASKSSLKDYRSSNSVCYDALSWRQRSSPGSTGQDRKFCIRQDADFISNWNMTPQRWKSEVAVTDQKWWKSSAGVSNSTSQLVSFKTRSIWHRYNTLFTATFALLTAYGLWQGLHTAATLMSVPLGPAYDYELMGGAFIITVLAMAVLRSRFTINPDRVLHLALGRLNASPSILEVMGAPLLAGRVRLCVSSGGGVRWRGPLPYPRPQRVALLFPLEGALRRGVVALEVKKKSGTYHVNVMTVDVEAGEGRTERLWVVGDEATCMRTSLLDQLREPLAQAQQLNLEYDQEDDVESDVDKVRALQPSQGAASNRLTWQDAWRVPAAAITVERVVEETEPKTYDILIEGVEEKKSKDAA